MDEKCYCIFLCIHEQWSSTTFMCMGMREKNPTHPSIDTLSLRHVVYIVDKGHVFTKDWATINVKN